MALSFVAFAPDWMLPTAAQETFPRYRHLVVASDQGIMVMDCMIVREIESEKAHQVVDREQGIYPGSSFRLVEAPFSVGSIQIPANPVYSRMNCTGLAFLPLVGGPYVIDAAAGLAVAQKFGKEVTGPPQPGDIGIMSVGSPNHWVYAVDPDQVLSKDQHERVYSGPWSAYPGNYGAPTFFRLDLAKIHVWDAEDGEAEKDLAGYDWPRWEFANANPRVQKRKPALTSPPAFRRALLKAANDVAAASQLGSARLVPNERPGLEANLIPFEVGDKEKKIQLAASWCVTPEVAQRFLKHFERHGAVKSLAGLDCYFSDWTHDGMEVSAYTVVNNVVIYMHIRQPNPRRTEQFNDEYVARLKSLREALTRDLAGFLQTVAPTLGAAELSKPQRPKNHEYPLDIGAIPGHNQSRPINQGIAK